MRAPSSANDPIASRDATGGALPEADLEGGLEPAPYAPVGVARSAVVQETERLRQQFDSTAYGLLNPDVRAAIGDNHGALFDHWRDFGMREGRPASGIAPYFERSWDIASFERKALGVSHVGFFGSPTGLGTAARNQSAALASVGIPVDRIPVAIDGTQVACADARLTDQAGRIRNEALGRRTRIFQINADMCLNFFLGAGAHALHDAYSIGFWVWELAAFRDDWQASFGAFEEIWTPTEFCRQAIGAKSPVPVRTMPHPVTIDGSLLIHGRSHFHLPDDCFIFGYVFDASSLMERKNPEALVEAFKATFGTRGDVMLALKFHGSDADGDRVRRLHELANQRNIRIFGRVFSDAENVSFKAAIDCFVSPHRAEGFGLNIAEAMLLGKPVIATDYSGNTDFMAPDNSYPVDYRLVPLKRDFGPYLRGSLWAEPDFDALCAAMQSVVDDPDEAAARGRQAAIDIAERHSLEAVGYRMGLRLQELGVFEDLPLFARLANRSRASRWRHPVTLNRQHLSEIMGFAHRPMMSVVVPVYNIQREYLEACVRSVLAQHYPFWDLVLYDDGSTNPETKACLSEIVGTDARIKVVFGEENKGIAGATNAALALTSGDFVALLDNDDELTPDALIEAVRWINKYPDADLFYSDEDKIDEAGNYCDTYYKPDWSPEHLESVMYLLHLMVIRREKLLEIGGFRPEVSGAQDYDVALRMSRVARRIVHIPKILYHWRKIPGSAAAEVTAKPSALDAGRLALADHIAAEGRDAVVEPGLLRGFYRVRDRLSDDVVPTLVVFTDNRSKVIPERSAKPLNMVSNFLKSILGKTEYAPGYRLLVVDNGNLTARQIGMIRKAKGSVVSYPGSTEAFNFSKKANFALGHVKTEHVVLLNDDMEVINPGWLEALMEMAQRPRIGAVGARLLYPSGAVQHCGVVLGVNDNTAHIYHQAPGDHIGYNGYTHTIRNYLAVTGACLASRMSVIENAGGFDERLAIDYNDIDLCLRIHALGYRIVYTPFCELYHFEGATQPRTKSDDSERALFMGRWADLMRRDPMYNDNLSRRRIDFAAD